MHGTQKSDIRNSYKFYRVFRIASEISDASLLSQALVLSFAVFELWSYVFFFPNVSPFCWLPQLCKL